MKRILIIEDDYMLNTGLCYNLELDGCQTVPVYKVFYMRKIICMGIIVLMTLFCTVSAQAAGGAENTGIQGVITPKFSYISLLNAGLSISSSGKATCLGHASAYDNFSGSYKNVGGADMFGIYCNKVLNRHQNRFIITYNNDYDKEIDTYTASDANGYGCAFVQQDVCRKELGNKELYNWNNGSITMWFDFDTTGQHTFWTKMAHTWDVKGVSGVSVSYGGISVSFNNHILPKMVLAILGSILKPFEITKEFF